jgi:TolB-like protein
MKIIHLIRLIFILFVLNNLLFITDFASSQDVKDNKYKYIVAIFPLDDNVATEETRGLGIEFADSLTSELSKRSGFKVVERQMLNKIIEELNLSSSGVIDPNTAIKAGKLLGANVLIMGSFLKFKEIVKINIRMIDTETGAIIKTASIKGKFNDILDLEEKLVNEIALQQM